MGNLAVYWKPLPMVLLGAPTLAVAALMTKGLDSIAKSYWFEKAIQVSCESWSCWILLLESSVVHQIFGTFSSKNFPIILFSLQQKIHSIESCPSCPRRRIGTFPRTLRTATPSTTGDGPPRFDAQNIVRNLGWPQPIYRWRRSRFRSCQWREEIPMPNLSHVAKCKDVFHSQLGRNEIKLSWLYLWSRDG